MAARAVTPPALRYVPHALVGAFFLYAFVRGGLAPHGLGRTYHGLLWMMALLGAFVGAGGFVLRRSGVQRPSFALSGAAGLAAYVAVGGVVLLLGFASRPYLVLSVAVGLALGAVSLARAKLHAFRRRAWVARIGRARAAPFATTALVLVVAFLAGDAIVRTISEVLHPRDDLIAYVPLAQDIVDRGASIQPFSFRRTCVLGGQELLHATFLAPHVDGRLLRAVESGIGGLLLLAFALDSGKRSRRLLPLLALASLPILAIQNLASDTTSAVLLLGGTMLTQERTLSPRARTLLGAGLLAAFVTLRNTNLAPALVLLVLDRVFTDDRGDARLRNGLAALACFVGVLLPWLRASWRSNDAWLFPLDSGYYQPAFALVTQGSPSIASMTTSFYGATFGSGLWLVAAMVTAALLDRPRQRALLPLFLATLSVLAILLLRVPDTDRHAMTRYLHPFVTALWVGGAIFAARGMRRTPSPAVLATAAGVAALLVRGWTTAADQRSYNLFEALRHAGGDRDTTRIGIDGDGPHAIEAPPDRPPHHEVDYAAVQGAVPPGELILAMVDEPAKLDFARNPIYLVDLPGAEAPPPGYPDPLDGPGLAKALADAGIRWVIVVLPGRSTEAYLTSTYHSAKPGTVGRMLSQIESALKAYQTLPPALRVATTDDLALVDLHRASP